MWKKKKIEKNKEKCRKYYEKKREEGTNAKNRKYHCGYSETPAAETRLFCVLLEKLFSRSLMGVV
jgi:hypothetical protein